MEEYGDDMKGESPGNIGLYINGINYSYSIYKSDYDKKTLIIKLYDSTNGSNIYYTYEGDITKCKKDIQFLDSFNNLDEINKFLNDIFNKGNAQVEEKHGEYYLKLIYIKSGINKISNIHLIKKEKLNDELEDKINKLENNYKDLYNKYEELKEIKENEIGKIVKEVIFDKEIKFI